MKQLISIFIFTSICLSHYAQKINVHVKKLAWIDKDLFSNSVIEQGEKEVDATYTFDLKKKKLHFINKERDIDKDTEILDFNLKDGIYNIVYKDVYRFDESIVWYPTAIIDPANHSMSMIFPEPPRNLIGIDYFKDFVVTIK